MLDLVIDFDDTENKRQLYECLKGLKGLHRVQLTVARQGRSSLQNRLYWGTAVTEFQKFLNEQGEPYTKEQAHEILKGKFLREDVPDPTTGELLTERVKSTTELDTNEFAEFYDQCRAWLKDMFGIDTPEPRQETSDAE